MKYKTDQEAFWASSFGNDYIARNRGQQLLASNLNFFVKALKFAGRPESLIEFGANIGMNLAAIKSLFPEIKLHGVEINSNAAEEMKECIGADNVSNCSIFDFNAKVQYTVSLIKGVLIHIAPEMLPVVYGKLYESSIKYILICEYYNPSPMAISYRGHENRLFKRDFAGEMLEKYTNLSLVDYGFVYKRDPSFPQDDITWFLLKKN